MQNLHRRFDRYYIGQIYGGDFAKICGLLRMHELYCEIFSKENYAVFKKKKKLVKLHILGVIGNDN